MTENATSSEKWGSVAWDTGKYPAKIYTIDGVLIYQVENGGTNAGKAPKGGVMFQSSDALSMLDAIANPITFYGSAVINQSGHSGDLYNYYWTSYSRGTDGRNSPNEPQWHNAYLDGYIPLRAKSIYDPCPYLYRIPSNGTWNQFNMQLRWTYVSYTGGGSWNMNTKTSWFISGYRVGWSSVFANTGREGWYRSSTTGSQAHGYALWFDAGGGTHRNYSYARSTGSSVRCIEDDRCARLSFQLSLTIMHWACSPCFLSAKSMQKLPSQLNVA